MACICKNTIYVANARPSVVLSIAVTVIGQRLRVCKWHMIRLDKCLRTELPVAGHHLANVNGFITVFKIKFFEGFKLVPVGEGVTFAEPPNSKSVCHGLNAGCVPAHAPKYNQ